LQGTQDFSPFKVQTCSPCQATCGVVIGCILLFLGNEIVSFVKKKKKKKKEEVQTCHVWQVFNAVCTYNEFYYGILLHHAYLVQQ